MKILAIDPGSISSGMVVWDSKKEVIVRMAIMPNEDLRREIELSSAFDDMEIVIEMMGYQGVQASERVIYTGFWIGRFFEVCGECELVVRKKIVLHFCGTSRGKDKDVRAALIKRFGEPGKKKTPGKLYGVKTHLWSALALAVYYGDLKRGDL